MKGRRGWVLIFIMFIVSSSAMLFGCERLQNLFTFGKTPEGSSGAIVAAPAPGGKPPGVNRAYIEIEPVRCCTITDFQAGTVTIYDNGEFSITETDTVPYVPGTYIGIGFDYISNTGKPIQYLEEEYFPAAPQNWASSEGSLSSYKIYPEENRAVYTTLLTSDSKKFVSYWGFNPSGDPLGVWNWDIYLDGQYLTTVTFTVVPPAN